MIDYGIFLLGIFAIKKFRFTKSAKYNYLKYVKSYKSLRNYFKKMFKVGGMREILSYHIEEQNIIKETGGEVEEYCSLYGWCCNAGNASVSIGSYSMDIITFILSLILLLTLCFLVMKLSLNYISLQIITFKPNGFQSLKPVNNNKNNNNNNNEEEEDRNSIFSKNVYNQSTNDSSYSTFSFSDQSNDENHQKRDKNNNKVKFLQSTTENEFEKYNNNNNNNNNNINNNSFFTSSDTESIDYISIEKKRKSLNSFNNININNNNNNNNKNNKMIQKKDIKNNSESNPNFDYGENQTNILRAKTLRPVHYLYILIVLSWLILQSLILFIPIPTSSSPFLQIFDTLLYEVHNNAIIILAFFKNDGFKSVIGTVIITMISLLLLSITGYSYEILDSCGICELFFPAPQAFYTYLLLSIIYLIILLLLYSKFPKKPRKTIKIWVWYLFIIYFFSALAAALILFWKIDAGFCMIDLIVFVYTLSYSPLLYFILVKDSNKLYENEESLLDNLDPSDTEAIIERAMELCKRYKIGLIPFHYLHFGERLGVGAAGEVYKANYLGTPIAVKRLFDKKSQALEEFFREVTVMSKLSHPNIILFMGVSISSHGDRYIITEIMDKGSIFDLIHPNLSFSAIRNPDTDNDLSGPRIKRILIQCARGIAYLHSFQPPILHRDLKSHNLLVDNNWNVKVADFGLSRAQSLTTMTAAGTPQWSAPEVIRQDYYTEKADVFSFGVIIFELLSREIPYMNMGPLTAAHQVAYEGLRLRFPNGSDPAYVQLAEDCWEENPADRPNFTDIVKQLEVMPPPVIVTRRTNH